MCSYANTDEKQETFLHMCKISSNKEGRIRLFTEGPDGEVEAHAIILTGLIVSKGKNGKTGEASHAIVY